MTDAQPPATTVPAADVHTDAELVRQLLSRQHPDLAGLDVRLVANGWDNAVFRLGSELCVRLPRRATAHRLLLNEVRWLPFLAPRLPLPIPAAVRRGAPDAGYPYHWAVVPWFGGYSAADAVPQERDAYAGQLAAFLRALHVPAPADAPRNPVRGVPLQTRADAFAERIATGLLPEPVRLAALFDEAVAAPAHSGPRLWLHGDPHPHNLVIDGLGTGDGGDAIDGVGAIDRGGAPDGVGAIDRGGAPDGGRARLAAVVDFGDIASGDPASDLAVSWLHFTARGRAEFRAGLKYDDATWLRARGWAVHLAAMMALLPPGDALHPVGLHALRELLADA